jgi:predicted ester cyclase
MKKLFIIPLVFLLCFTFGCQQQVQEGVTEEEADAIAERSLGIWNEGNLALVDELYNPSIVRHDSNLPEDIVGLSAFKDYVTMLRTSYPDFSVTFDDVIPKGYKITLRWTVTGTNSGPLQTPVGEFPPTGKKIRISGVDIVTLVNGKMSEDWVFYNALDSYQQLGFILSPPQPQETPEEEK